MNCDAASVATSETEQEPESDQLGDDFLPKNAYDPHAKWKKRSEIWDYFIKASISNDLFWLHDSMSDCFFDFCAICWKVHTG